jgi:aryl-alcohol dehydrogenase-like predicted oxidoreductase
MIASRQVTLGEGYLTGKMDGHTRFDPKTDFRSEFPRFSPEALAANMPVVELLKRVAEKKNATPAQVALAWLLAKKPWIVPIPGTRREDHLVENLGATSVELTAGDLLEMGTALSKTTVHACLKSPWDRSTDQHDWGPAGKTRRCESLTKR